MRAGAGVVCGGGGGAGSLLKRLAELGGLAAAGGVGGGRGNLQVGEAGVFGDLAIFLGGTVERC